MLMVGIFPINKKLMMLDFREIVPITYEAITICLDLG